ncbi:YomM [Bacillus atrophaeus UCMB-5137]|nr:YomM [Bacillus atrophaeus UCMB-5137]
MSIKSIFLCARRINPHHFKASCITYLLEVKKIKIELISKYAKMN